MLGAERAGFSCGAGAADGGLNACPQERQGLGSRRLTGAGAVVADVGTALGAELWRRGEKRGGYQELDRDVELNL